MFSKSFLSAKTELADPDLGGVLRSMESFELILAANSKFIEKTRKKNWARARARTKCASCANVQVMSPPAQMSPRHELIQNVSD